MTDKGFGCVSLPLILSPCHPSISPMPHTSKTAHYNMIKLTYINLAIHVETLSYFITPNPPSTFHISHPTYPPRPAFPLAKA